MTQEEKAKAYDEALERARKAYNAIPPESYGARKIIEDAFPELRESEDEQALCIIKKRMCYDPVPISDEDRRIVENWLEKQKEPDWNKKPCLTCQEYEKGFKQGHLEGCTAGYNKAMKEVEQKPVEWSEEDEKELDCIINVLDRLGFEEFCKSSRDQDIEEERFYYKEIQFLKRLKSLRPKVNANSEKVNANSEKVNVNWSEEDEKMLKCCLIAINHYEKTRNIGDHLPTKFNIDGYLASVDKVKFWLKSLRTQPKVELTLLDENIIKAAVAFVEQNDHFNCWGGIDKHTVIKALRSIKPHWKPSEEQMKALQNAVALTACDKELARLYNQLKKM